MQRRGNLAVQFYNRNHNTTLSLESFDPVSALYDEFKRTEFAKQ